MSEEQIKEELKKMFEKEEQIHISTIDGRVKIENVTADIVGIYNNFMSIKSMYKNYYASYTIKYIDILIGKVKIKELNELIIDD